MHNQSQSDRFTTRIQGKAGRLEPVFVAAWIGVSMLSAPLLGAEGMAGLEGPLRGVDQAGVDDHDAGMLEPVLNPLQVTLEPLLQPWELRPVDVQADAEQSGLQRSHGGESPWHDDELAGRDERAAGNRTRVAPEVKSILSGASCRC